MWGILARLLALRRGPVSRGIIGAEAEDGIMTVRLELKPEVEASLNDQAKAKGVPLDTYLQNVIEDLARTKTTTKPDQEEFRMALDRLAEMGKNLRSVPSSAFSRESIYQDHN